MVRAALATAALSGPAGTWANDEALARCRLEQVADKRLACYDAIPAAARSAQGAAPVIAPVAGTPAPQTAAAPATANTFGLSKAREESDGVNSSLTGRFEGWGPRTQFKLANGQVWEVEDGSSASLWLDSPKVRVRSGFAGAYYLEVEGTNRSPRVRRLK